MNRENWTEALLKLPLQNPTEEDMARYCPHLTPEQAIETFNSNQGQVAIPSTLINGSYFVLLYIEKRKVAVSAEDRYNPDPMKRRVNSTVRLPSWLTLSRAHRTNESYIEELRNGGRMWHSPYKNEAIQFAKENWGNELILVDWDWLSVLEFFLLKPKTEAEKIVPSKTQALYVAFNRMVGEIFNDNSASTSELLDNAIIRMTLNPIEGLEMNASYDFQYGFNCGYCGSPIRALGVACERCGHSFIPFRQSIYSGDSLFINRARYRCWHQGITLSPRMVEFLEQNGHTFQENLVITA